MSTMEETQSTPAEAPAAEVVAPADQEESMDTTPAESSPQPSTEPTTQDRVESVKEPPPSTPEPSKSEDVVKAPPPVMTESNRNIPKTDSGKFVKPAHPLIKPPVPKTIQTDRPSKQSIEQMEEAKLKAKFGGLSKPGGSQFLQKRLNKGMKYFDSGDYNMAKQSGKLKMRPLSGKPGGIPPPPKPTGEAIPTPDSIHHRKQSSEISKLAV